MFAVDLIAALRMRLYCCYVPYCCVSKVRTNHIPLCRCWLQADLQQLAGFAAQPHGAEQQHYTLQCMHQTEAALSRTERLALLDISQASSERSKLATNGSVNRVLGMYTSVRLHLHSCTIYFLVAPSSRDACIGTQPVTVIVSIHHLNLRMVYLFFVLVLPQGCMG